MTNKIKRPPTVWLTQTLLMIFALIWLFSLVINLVMLARSGAIASTTRIVVGVSILAGFVLLLVIAFWGLARRRLYGKWLGLVSLVCLWLLVLYIQLRPPTGPFKRYTFDSPAELVGAVIMAVLISGLFLTLILRLAFAKVVNAFFERGTSPGEEAHLELRNKRLP